MTRRDAAGRPSRRALARALAGGWAALLAAALPAGAQEFSRYLRCEGALSGSGPSQPAHADFALRMNNRTALIQRSNVLPVGERLSFIPTPAVYTMTYRLAPQGTLVLAMPGWFRNTILVQHPDLQRLNQIRIGIDRQSGALEGVLLNEADEPLARLDMRCEANTEPEAPPKF